ncbi:HEAT repeat domain-containing protein [Embleya sp. MST-111070]|uniref:HEAT repeat domain-containing protein n=1 Tax=Embleya sp. MST-111070 TaxID=3398231 RepID=UPI003F735331
MLGSDDTVVRQWAAEALAGFGVRRAVPRLRQTYESFRQCGKRSDHSEGVVLRWALTELGARLVVLPLRTAALRCQVEGSGLVGPTAHLLEAIGDLADHGQAVLSFQVWRVEADGRARGTHGPDIDWNVDIRSPRSGIVAECRNWALLAAEATAQAPDRVATICWIDAADL